MKWLIYGMALAGAFVASTENHPEHSIPVHMVTALFWPVSMGYAVINLAHEQFHQANPGR